MLNQSYDEFADICILNVICAEKSVSLAKSHYWIYLHNLDRNPDCTENEQNSK